MNRIQINKDVSRFLKDELEAHFEDVARLCLEKMHTVYVKSGVAEGEVFLDLLVKEINSNVDLILDAVKDYNDEIVESQKGAE